MVDDELQGLETIPFVDFGSIGGVDPGRERLGLVEGEPKYDELENRLVQAPVISVRRTHCSSSRTFPGNA